MLSFIYRAKQGATEVVTVQVHMEEGDTVALSSSCQRGHHRMRPSCNCEAGERKGGGCIALPNAVVNILC